MSAPGDAGVIHDIGYQHYEGPRLGRRYAALAIYVHSVRAAFGIGRSAKAKLLPLGLLGIACITSLILVVVSTQLGVTVLSYVGVASTFSYAITAFVGIVAPELVSRDLRNTLLPLYFSRPPQRSDYALAKLGALITAAFVMYAGPMLLMFVGLALSTDEGITGVFTEAGNLALGLLAAAIHATVIGAVALPLASLTGRRVFATGMIIGVFLLTAPVSGTLRALGDGATGQLAGLLNPVDLLSGVDNWLFGEEFVQVGSYGPIYGLTAVVLTAAGTALLLRRYKKVKS
ncbi:ABC transporter permease [Amycolatopsis cihanbeyliensis]|uniref:ABC-2 type transport system permease protein n=1 Tax=Amycolatopsis cihanbeyliensis TaxID=1128664 RepID=A0A542DBJ7_AMYCI|nr:ABC transporter permease [Amycolatopsis cihanbeyliensis]TQJ00458.1 ABC-2 type transport system permease protein [Amycolatopsis cihanbeyliensis]